MRAGLLLVGLIVIALGRVAPAADLDLVGEQLPVFFTPSVADLFGAGGQGDGWLDILGARNDGTGRLVPVSPTDMGLGALFAPSRAFRDTRVADFNGDGLPDIVGNTYSCYEDADSKALLFFNQGVTNGIPRFVEDPGFRQLNQGQGLRGHGETIVVADFNNDGHLDIFLPYYTFPYETTSAEAIRRAFGPPGERRRPRIRLRDAAHPEQRLAAIEDPAGCQQNAPQNYLLINDGTGQFTDVAVPAGVSLSDWPDIGLRVEGVQAVDFDGDGFIDLYAASHLFINNGDLTFTDKTAFYGLDVLFAQVGASINGPPGGVFDEGAKFLDWNNDGNLDLLLHHPTAGPILFEFDGSRFSSWRRVTGEDFSESYGMNVYDLDNDGREDIATMGGRGCGNQVLLNRPQGFVRASVRPTGGASFTGLSNGQSGMAFGDLNRDGIADILYPIGHLAHFVNATPGPAGSGSLSIEVLGLNGERNQHGRVVQVSPSQAPGVIFTRVVDGGSGYMAQNQYPLLVGTPYAGTHAVQVFYPGQTVALFSIRPGQVAKVRQDGTVAITSAPPAGPVPSNPGMAHTIGLYRSSDRTFYLRDANTQGFASLTIPFGAAGDIPLFGDWDGDGTATIGVYRPSNRTFYLRRSNTPGFADHVIPFGALGDVPIAGDWDGNGTTTIGVYRPGDRTFYLRNSNSAGAPDAVVPYGAAGDKPIVGDWDGNGTTTIGVYRPGNRTFYLRNANSIGAAHTQLPYGAAGDVPLVGDWDGNGTTTIGAYRPSDRTFYLRNRNTVGIADLVIPYGASGDTPLAGHWDGHVVTSISVYRPADRTFYLRYSNTQGPADAVVTYGAPGDIPLVGDWDGDGVATIGVYRPSDLTFYLRNSNTPGAANVTIPMGAPGDIPIVGDWTGDGMTTVGVYRPSNQRFHLRLDHVASGVPLIIVWGAEGDLPIVGDWDGNGTTTLGVYRPSDQTFHLRNCNSFGPADLQIAYGPATGFPLAGDWTGDGRSKIGSYDPASRTFHLRLRSSINSAVMSVPYGANGDIPLPGMWKGP